jgi:two-component system response regulator YesN
VGLQVTETFKPDVIICDIAMPDMDGVQFCRELNKAYSQVADGKPGVFILTGLPESERSDSLLKDLGVLDILSKPVDLNQLALSLNRLSAGRIRPT